VFKMIENSLVFILSFILSVKPSRRFCLID